MEHHGSGFFGGCLKFGSRWLCDDPKLQQVRDLVLKNELITE